MSIIMGWDNSLIENIACCYSVIWIMMKLCSRNNLHYNFKTLDVYSYQEDYYDLICCIYFKYYLWELYVCFHTLDLMVVVYNLALCVCKICNSQACFYNFFAEISLYYGNVQIQFRHS